MISNLSHTFFRVINFQFTFLNTMATRSRKRKPPSEDLQDETEAPKDTSIATHSSSDTLETSPKRRKVKAAKKSSKSSSPIPDESPEDLKPESSQSETASSPVSKPITSKEDMLTIVTWNVNGVRAWTKSGAWKYVPEQKPDVICLQEIKSSTTSFPHELKVLKEYTRHVYSPTHQKGYSGTAILSRFKPISITEGIGVAEHDEEGRVITAEYERLYIVTAYIPNSKRKLVRLPYRQEWDSAFTEYICGLDKKKPVILCGDLNVAHEEIDLANPDSNRNKTAGFSDEERAGFTKLLDSGFVDTFRHLYPDKKGAYSWWSYVAGARGKNIGWRLDYFVVSARLMGDVRDVIIESEVKGSDHCPVRLQLSGSSL